MRAWSLLLALGCATAPRASEQCVPAGDRLLRLDPSHVVARWSDGSLSYGELSKAHSAAFRRLHNKHLRERFDEETKLVEREVMERLVRAEAARRSSTVEAYLDAIAGAPREVDDAELESFYEENAAQIGRPLDEVREDLRSFLARRDQRALVREEVDRLREAAGLELDLPAPAFLPAELALDGRPRKGAAKPKLTIVEFSDFECPHCRRAAAELDALLAEHGEDLALVFLHFPLSFHARALPAAIASRCAQAVGRFWPYHDALFAAEDLEEQTLSAIASKLGLDLEAFAACRAAPETEAAVRADLEVGQAAGVTGTPSFFIDGIQHPEGVPSADTIRRLLAARRE